VHDVIVNKLGSVMGVEVRGVELSHVQEEQFRQIREAFHRYLLLVFPEQRINEAQQAAFRRRFGELQVRITVSL
jgi:alpha-ketoglutarate-dependent taurine dioxygenase